MTHPRRTPSLARRAPLLAVGAAMVGLVATSLPASGQQSPAPPLWEDYGFQGEGHARVDNADRRVGRVAPTQAQLAAADRLGATAARFNEFGSPHVLINREGTLSAPRQGAAADIARDFVRDNAQLFRLDSQRVDALELLRDAPLYDSPDLAKVRDGQPPANPDVAHVVLFRQRFGDLAAGSDGLLTVGVKRDGSVGFVTSSVAGDSTVVGEQRLDAAAAIAAAAKDVDMAIGALTEVDSPGDPWTTFESEIAADLQRARLVALPTPENGVRRAWEVTLLDTALDEHGNPTGFTSFVDAETGQVLTRTNLVEHFAQGAGPSTVVGAATQSDDDEGTNSRVPLPQWRVFPANPPFVDFPSTKGEPITASEDTRVLWCWDNETNPEECLEEQRNSASRLPWDTRAPSNPTFTTDGNNASTAVAEANFRAPDLAANRPFSATRDYDYQWRDRWHVQSCNPALFGTFVEDLNDESASVTNLFVMHNRMHDWSYHLGFTEENYNMQQSNFGNTGPDRENDPEIGQAQGGRRTPIFGRDNANQLTPPDGIAPITNQYLWQPLAGAFYSPCVDGAYDMAVVAHEYTHAITNRMIAGPDSGTGDSQGQTESWSDLGFAAYFSEFAISSGDEGNPLALGPYVTGDTQSAIRNYSMNDSPLQYGDLEYDGNGLTSPHANGEIWSAVNYDIFEAFNAKYDGQFPSSDSELQRSCARGEKAADDCPGNRRWNQVQFDSFLLSPRDATMVDSRDAMLAADLLRFDGANQDELWNAFAKRGLGQSANSAPIVDDEDGNRTDLDAIPAYDSPRRGDEAQVTFVGPDGATNMEVFTGVYEARSTPIADTDPATGAAADTASFVPGTYDFVARADGFGMQRFSLTLGANQTRRIEVPLRRNAASGANGAAITGDGVNLESLIDDTEETNWASRESEGTASEGKGEGAQVEGRQVTVDLAGDAPVDVREIQVSAALRGAITETESGDTPPDPGSQSRFSALRSFDVFTCDASRADCANAESFTQVFSSADDAFPGKRPRPKVPDFILRPFDVTDSKATHVKLVVRDNQCTGGPDFQGETNPDSDPNFNPDCDTENANTIDRAVLRPPFEQVRAAELQVFSGPAPAPKDLPAAPLTAQAQDIRIACPEDRVPRNSREDIAGNPPHELAMDCMVWYEIAAGTSDTTYEPRGLVTRGQMATFIVNLIEKTGGQLDEGDDAFSDDNGHTHESSINKLAAAGIVSGVGDGMYAPDALVTRAQMAKFLVEGYEFRSGKLLAAGGDFFPDDDDERLEPFINQAAQAGFATGRNGRYEPRAAVVRSEMASFLSRDLTLLVTDGTTQPKA
jgi:hypothetical protein